MSSVTGQGSLSFQRNLQHFAKTQLGQEWAIVKTDEGADLYQIMRGDGTPVTEDAVPMIDLYYWFDAYKQGFALGQIRKSASVNTLSMMMAGVR